MANQRSSSKTTFIASASILWLWLGIMAMLTGVATGCVGPELMGERALEQGAPDQALEHYERAISNGSQEPDVYYGAAQAAQQIGAFAKAERYFSQALRYGGGVDVARALAEFYIQTSNFGQAVEVFRYLIRIEPNEEALQPMYSNMGTALMYAGHYLEAESYLLLAHEQQAVDPIPYLNLGILYDRHLRNWPKAIRFYECFLELTNDTGQARTVQHRLREMHGRRSVDTSRVNLTCGEPYRPAPAEHHDLYEIFDVERRDGDAAAGQPAGGEVIDLDLPLEYEPQLDAEIGDDEAIDLGIGDGVDEPAARAEIVDEPDGDEGESSTLRRATEIYESGRYDDAVEYLEEIDELDVAGSELLGKAYYQVGRFEEAAVELASAVDERPTPQAVETLLLVYDHLGQADARQRVCDRFSGWPQYDAAVADCDG